MTSSNSKTGTSKPVSWHTIFPVFHPLLLGIYPVLALLATNLENATLGQALPSLLLIGLASALLFCVLIFFLRDSHRAGLLASIYLIYFLAYHHLAQAAARLLGRSLSSMPDFNRYFLAITVPWLIIATWWIGRWLRRDLRNLTRYLNTVGAVAVGLSLFTIISHQGQIAASETTSDSLTNRVTNPEITPDIYFIVLDAYVRADVLADLFHYNNSPFIEGLTERGFFVAGDSHSNYAQTGLSLASALNFEYVNYMADRVGPTHPSRRPLSSLTTEANRVEQFLDQHGYTTVAISSGYYLSEFDNFDRYYAPTAYTPNRFEEMLLSNTLPGAIFQLDLIYEIKRLRIHHNFDTLAQIPSLPGPKFVFAHLLSPHVPFAFDADGEKIIPSKTFDFNEVVESGLSREYYFEAYGEELSYINRRLLSTIDTILTQSSRPPIIVIQGDHGSRAFLDWGSVENTCMYERLSILNAYHFPDESATPWLSESITPVNTFRVIFNAYFDAGLPLLENNSYFSLWETPYDLVNVNDRLDEDCS